MKTRIQSYSFIIGLVFSFFSCPLSAQMAPNFTVADSDGNEHNLYTDYLDQGKTVMLKLFFTTCPPCIMLAPSMEPFYQEWGAGENDVQFIELSTISTDTDDKVNTYKNAYGMTFPGVGFEGGSLSAIIPYTQGSTFGQYGGTPLFVIIAPDKSVQYDVYGNGITGQFAALDAALLATGAMKPDTTPVDTMQMDLLAPDFTVTDSEGIEHTLYEDYLDQGKSVMLKLFFTTCPPCLVLAPSMEPFYQEWGAGENDVEFIELSVLGSDTDAKVNTYKSNFGMSFPGVGSEGGSLAAVLPYQGGSEFGQYSGTPNFIVIAPDGTVQYDVFGNGIEGQFAALDAALLATGAVKPDTIPVDTMQMDLLAPDFTVTDSEGVEHTLYEDYLNQGKTVMLKLFFTTCPPCLVLAPSMEPFYQEWGAGANDVEFFELSVLSTDTDTKVNTYKSNFGMTFPGVGSDGGSLAAAQPYQVGSEFGQYSGTPNFIVIAPDGSVQYDVFGNGIEGQFAALDTALLLTGAIKPDTIPIDTMVVIQPTQVTGQVNYAIGNVPMRNVTVNIYATESINEMPIFTTTTDSTGTLLFSIFPDSIPETAVIRAKKTGVSAGRGLSGLDLIAIQKHLLNIIPFTEPYQYLISDGNGTLSISALDLVTFRKIILGIDSNFSNGKIWYFIPEDVDLEVENSSAPSGYRDYILLKDIIDGITTLSFKVYKRGDLNGSIDPNE